MASTRFRTCLAEILRHEGGYVDHPRDPGGATNMGITRKTLARWRKVKPWWHLPKADVKALRRTEASTIYRALYWAPIAGNALPPGVDLCLFDFAVNSGPGRAVKTLQRQLRVRADARVGPITLGALRAQCRGMGAATLIAALCDRRLGFLQRLKTFPIFGRGWNRRVADIRKKALAHAGANPNFDTRKGTNIMDVLNGYKTYIVGILMLLAGVAQALGVDIPGFDGQSTGHLIMEGFAVVFLRRGLKSEIGNA